jgi:hypothetical protein
MRLEAEDLATTVTRSAALDRHDTASALLMCPFEATNHQCVPSFRKERISQSAIGYKMAKAKGT